MARSWIENVASEYFRKLGFLVLENVSYFDRAQDKSMAGWQEIDIVAVKEDETKIVSCKRGMNPAEYKKLPQSFAMHIDFLRTSEFSWAVNQVKLEKVLVIEYPRPRHIELLKKNGISVISLRDLLLAYVDLLRKELMKEGKEGLEPNFVTRTIKALFFHDIIYLKKEPYPRTNRKSM